jgi:uncharacterized protein (DUF2384 family)
MEEDKINELLELFIYGSEVFGDKKKFVMWMNLSIISLGTKPIKIVNTVNGISTIRSILGRIEHGVFS